MQVVPYRRTEEGAFVNKRQEKTHVVGAKHVESVCRSVTGLLKPPSHNVGGTLCHSKDALPIPLLQVNSVNLTVRIKQLFY